MTVLVVFFFSPSVSASPSQLTGLSGNSASLAVLLTIILLLSFLLACKRIFLKVRKLRQPFANSISAQSPARSSKIFSFGEGDGAKAAFFVGFFGSPGWETRVQNLAVKSRLEQPSFNHSSVAGSIGSKSSRIRKIELIDGPSVLRTTGDMCILGGMHDATRLSRQRGSHSLRLPNRPILSVVTGWPVILGVRRFSLPSMSQKDVDSAMVGTSEFYRKNPEARYRHLSSLSLPENASQKLVISRKTLEPPFPVLSSQVTSPKPSSVPLYAISPPFPLSARPITKLENKVRLSHPYALAPGFVRQRLPSVSNDDKSRSKSALNHGLIPQQSPSSASRMADRFPKNSLRPTSFRMAPSLKPVDPARIARRPRRPSILTRRSLTIGPSPLRSMILPDASDSSVGLDQSASKISSRNPNSSVQSFGFGHSSSHALAYTSVVSQPCAEREHDRDGGANGFSNMRSYDMTSETEKPDMLLDVLRELVEETSRWDPGMFKDGKFKALIENSKHPLCNARAQIVEVGGICNEAQRERSVEVDLSLLGVDVFQDGGDALIPEAGYKNLPKVDEDAEVLSFRKYGNQDTTGNYVGIAF